MTIKGFFIFSFLQWVLFTALKIGFFKYEVFGTTGISILIYYALTIVIAIAMVRRLGVINFLECLFIICLWVAGGALMDLLVTSVFAGLSIFYNPTLWVGYGLAAITLFIAHKKRHIQIRHEQHAHHHGHH